jgi:hypothetical protein
MFRGLHKQDFVNSTGKFNSIVVTKILETDFCFFCHGVPLKLKLKANLSSNSIDHFLSFEPALDPLL